MNKNVSNAISALEQEVLETLLSKPLEPKDIALKLGIEGVTKRPNNKSTGKTNAIILGILWRLEREKLVKQIQERAPWELTDLGKEYIA